MKPTVQAIAAFTTAGSLVANAAVVPTEEGRRSRQRVDASTAVRNVYDAGNDASVATFSERYSVRRLKVACACCHLEGFNRGPPGDCINSNGKSSVIGAPDIFNPDLCVFGKPIGSLDPSYDYSRSMKKSTLVWDEQTLDEFLINPMNYINGTTMIFEGMSNPDERKKIIESLKANCKDNDDYVNTTSSATTEDFSGGALARKTTLVSLALMTGLTTLLWSSASK